MPRPKKTISDFDVRLGAVVRSKRTKADLSRMALAQKSGIPEANLKRRESGENEFTISELERVASVVNVTAAAMVEEALEDYGGLEKLIAEHAPVSEVPPTVEDKVDYYDGPMPYALAADKEPRPPGHD